MYGMTGNYWKLMEMAKKARNQGKLQDMDGNGCNLLEWLKWSEMAVNGWTITQVNEYTNIQVNKYISTQVLVQNNICSQIHQYTSKTESKYTLTQVNKYTIMQVYMNHLWQCT